MTPVGTLAGRRFNSLPGEPVAATRVWLPRHTPWLELGAAGSLATILFAFGLAGPVSASVGVGLGATTLSVRLVCHLRRRR